jgi:IclR family transcriptional regulator, acetate operon repressor
MPQSLRQPLRGGAEQPPRFRYSLDIHIRDPLISTRAFGTLDGTEIVYLAKRDSTQPLRLYSAVGRRLPAHTTAIGKAILATYRDSELVKLLPKSLASRSPNSISDRAGLLRDLQGVRERGHSIDDEEGTIGLSCFGMAIPNVTPAAYAISIAIPTARLTAVVSERLIGVLSAAQEQLLARITALYQRGSVPLTGGA